MIWVRERACTRRTYKSVRVASRNTAINHTSSSGFVQHQFLFISYITASLARTLWQAKYFHTRKTLPGPSRFSSLHCLSYVSPHLACSTTAPCFAHIHHLNQTIHHEAGTLLQPVPGLSRYTGTSINNMLIWVLHVLWLCPLPAFNVPLSARRGNFE